MSCVRIKRGATLQLVLHCQDETDGSAIDMTGVTMASQVRDQAGRLVANVELTAHPETGVFTIAEPTDTWPLGRLGLDVKMFKTADVILKSETLPIEVLPAITR